MPAHRHRPRPNAREPEVLEALASSIDDAFCRLTGDDPAHLLRVITPTAGEELELGLLPLEAGTHPADAMTGFTAPAAWSAVGVVTAGRSEALVEERFSGADHRAPEPVRLTFLLARSGRAVTLLTPIGAPHTERRLLCEPPEGVVADACRLVLGLPTAEPRDGPEVWLAARWLDRLLALAIEQPGAVPAWDVAVLLHPLVAGGPAPTPAPTPAAVAALVDQSASEFGWERLRVLATRGRGTDAAVSPTVASWMDAGAFARHLLAAELPIDLLLAELDAVVPAAVMTGVRQALPASCRGRLR